MIHKLSKKQALIISLVLFCIVAFTQFYLNDIIGKPKFEFVDAISGFLFGYGLIIFFQVFRKNELNSE